MFDYELFEEYFKHFDKQNDEIIRLLTLLVQDTQTYKNITKTLSENLYGQ